MANPMGGETRRNLAGNRRLSRILALSAVACLTTISPARADRPGGWFGGGRSYELSADGSVRHQGKVSGSVKSIHDDQAALGFGTLTQAIKADKYRATRLRMTAYVKTEDVARQAGLWMRVGGKDKVNLAFDNMSDREIKGSTGWTKYEVVPDEATEIYHGFLVAGKGRGWVDDITFDVVDKDVKTTGLAVRPADREREASEGLPRTPRNLDFEGK